MMRFDRRPARVRFDDSLKTILSADMQVGVGAESAWRQLVDLMSRGRIPADGPTIARLRMLRDTVPTTVRAASARAVAFATPGVALVGFFAEDMLPVAAPVLRTAILPASDWLSILPRLTPEARSILRHRRDLPGEVVRGLQSFGATDFVLADSRLVADDRRDTPPQHQGASPDQVGLAIPVPPPDTPLSATPFVALGDVARGLPVVAEAMRRGERGASPDTAQGFEIADLVARIDAFQKRRETDAPLEAATASAPPTSFRYETDREGVIRGVEGVARGALVGVSFAHAARQGIVSVDAVMSGALRQRARFARARLEVGGVSDAAGSWLVAGEPAFDHATGRFTGYRGTARRPRGGEVMTAVATRSSSQADSLRQLVHELRTPTNAIAGFAELIETQLLGPVAPTYRSHATVIREQAAALIAAIEDLDTVARMDGQALEQRAGRVMLDPLLDRIAHELAPLADSRGAVVLGGPASALAVAVDDRLVERLISRLLGAVVSAAAKDERIALVAVAEDDAVILEITRPAAFGTRNADALMRIDADGTGDDGAGDGAAASLLGIGFTLRLCCNLARELGGALSLSGDRLTLRLPAAVDDRVGQAIN